MIEIQYTMRGVFSNDPSRITDGENVTSPIESLETLSSSLGISTLECSVPSFELAKQSCDYTESTVSSFSFVEADPDCLEPEFESQSPATPVPTEEEEFLANITGDVDEFGVRQCCATLPTLRFTQG